MHKMQRDSEKQSIGKKEECKELTCGTNKENFQREHWRWKYVRGTNKIRNKNEQIEINKDKLMKQ